MDADSKVVNVVLWVTTCRQAAESAIICTADVAGKFLLEEEAGAIVLRANESHETRLMTGVFLGIYRFVVESIL